MTVESIRSEARSMAIKAMSKYPDKSQWQFWPGTMVVYMQMYFMAQALLGKKMKAEKSMKEPTALSNMASKIQDAYWQRQWKHWMQIDVEVRAKVLAQL